MNNTPVFICSMPNGAYEKSLSRQSPHVQVVNIKSFQASDFVNHMPKSVLMRCYDLKRAQEVEAFFRRKGSRIINPVAATRLACRKDIYYQKLANAGIRVPKFLPNPSVQRILRAVKSGEWKYPFIWRRADMSFGQGMGLIRSWNDIQTVGASMGDGPKLMVKFVGTKEGQLWKKIRAYVVGNNVDLASRLYWTDWMIGGVDHQDTHAVTEAKRRANRTFELKPEWRDAILKAGRTMGTSLYSLDAIDAPDGFYILDVNTRYHYYPSEDLFEGAKKQRRLTHWKRVAEYMWSNK